MNATVTVPDAVAAILPFIAAALSSFLKDDKLSAGVNALIAFAAVVVTSVLCVYLVGGFDKAPLLIVGAVLAYVAYLLRNDYQFLLAYLQGVTSPLTPPAPFITPKTPTPPPPQA